MCAENLENYHDPRNRITIESPDGSEVRYDIFTRNNQSFPNKFYLFAFPAIVITSDLLDKNGHPDPGKIYVKNIQSRNFGRDILSEIDKKPNTDESLDYAIDSYTVSFRMVSNPNDNFDMGHQRILESMVNNEHSRKILIGAIQESINGLANISTKKPYQMVTINFSRLKNFPEIQNYLTRMLMPILFPNQLEQIFYLSQSGEPINTLIIKQYNDNDEDNEIVFSDGTSMIDYYNWFDTNVKSKTRRINQNDPKNDSWKRKISEWIEAENKRRFDEKNQ